MVIYDMIVYTAQKSKLEQLECLRSENNPPPPPMITHTIDSYQTPCHKMSKLQIKKKMPKIQILK